MATIQSPTKVYKLWQRINNRFGAGKDAKKKAKDKSLPTKDKQALKQNEQISKGLLIMRNVARGGLAGSPSKLKRFEKTRTKTLRIMKKYCKLVKSSKLESHEDLVKFRKSIKQMTIVVENINPVTVTADEDEGEVDLTALDGVDTATLDQQMEDPEFGEYPDEEFDPDEEAEASEEESEEESEEVPPAPLAPPTAGNVPPAPPPPPSADGAARFAKRLKALAPVIEKAQGLGTPEGQEVKLRVSEANVFARKKDFDQANAVLDQVEGLLKKALSETPPAPPAPPTEAKGKTNEAGPLPEEVRKQLIAAIGAWQKASDTVDGQISQLQSALRKEGDEDLNEIADKGLNAVTGNHKVKLIASLRNVSSAKGEAQKKAAVKANKLVASFQNHLNSDEQVMAVDENPFGVKVSIRQMLGDALKELNAAFRAVENA